MYVDVLCTSETAFVGRNSASHFTFSFTLASFIIIYSPILPVTWTASSPGPFFEILQRGYRVVAYNPQSSASGLQPNSQGTITCSVSSLGDFTASLDFIGTSMIINPTAPCKPYVTP